MTVPYIALYPTDFLADVGHLGNTELGIYWRLLLVYYRDGRPLSGDMDRLRRIAMAFSPEECAALERVLTEFFVLASDAEGRRIWRHKRADQELERATLKYENKSRGAAIARAKRAEKAAAADINSDIRTDTKPVSDGEPEPEPELKPKTLKPKTAPPTITDEGEKAPQRSQLVALVCLLREHGADVTPANPQLAEWLERRVTDEQALAALAEAKRCREKQQSRAPIGAAYLTQILKSQLSAPKARTESTRERIDRERREVYRQLGSGIHGQPDEAEPIIGNAERLD